MQGTYYFVAQSLMAAAFLGIGVYTLTTSANWPVASAMFVRIAGVLLVVFGGGELASVIVRFRRSGEISVARVMDVQRVLSVDAREAARRILTMTAWCFSFVLAIALIGFTIGLTLVTAAFMKGQARAGWKSIVGTVGVVYLLIWGVFGQLLGFAMREGILRQFWGG